MVFLALAGSILSLAGCASRQAAEFYVDAIVLKEMGRTDEAVEKLNTAVKADPRFSPAHSLLGDIYQESGQLPESAEAYEKAAKLNRWSFKDYFNLGKVYQVMKEFARAAKAYVRACRLKPDHFEAHISTAWCYFQLRQYDDALEYGRAANAIDPNISQVQKLLGDVYEAKKDYDQAINFYRQALEIHDSDPNAQEDVPQDANKLNIMMSLAVAYLKAERYKPAEEVLIQVIEIRPDSARAYQYLGDVYEAKKDYDQAIVFYKNALEILAADPNAQETALITGETTDIMTSLAVAYLRAGRYDPAKEVLAEIIDIQPDNGRAYQYLGYCYLRLKDNYDKSEEKLAQVQKAIDSYHKAVEINENDWAAHKGLGDADMLKMLHEKDDRLKATAIEHWKRSLQIKPDQGNHEKLRKLVEIYSR